MSDWSWKPPPDVAKAIRRGDSKCKPKTKRQKVSAQTVEAIIRKLQESIEKADAIQTDRLG